MMDQKLLRDVPAQKFGDQFKALREEILARIEEVCSRGQFIMGPELRSFEENFANWLGTQHAIGCASGSDALLLALMALGIGAGDEVITTPLSYFATVSAIVRTGARPVFADIDPASFNFKIEELQKKINSKTKALLPVHLYGQPCPMDEVLSVSRQRRLFVIEDCAQAHGTKFKGQSAGTFGDFGCFSFYPTKNLGAYGDGGLVVAFSQERSEEFKKLRLHGTVKNNQNSKVGINSRLDDIQAAVLNVKLTYLAQWIEMRRLRAHRYNQLIQSEGLGEVTLPSEISGGYHSYHQYVLRVPNRDALLKHLNENGIQAGVYYPTPLHLEKPFAFLGGRPGDFPEAERAAQEIIALPMYPELSEEDQVYVVSKIKEFYRP